MGWNPYQSLKIFASSQPPLLMFTICLMAFGLTMTILAHIIGVSEVPNPDVMDWNKFLNKLMDVDMCVPKISLVSQDSTINKEGKVAEHHIPTIQPIVMNMTHNVSAQRLLDRSRSMSAVLSSVVDSVSGEVFEHQTTVSASVKILVTFAGTLSSIKSLPSVVHGSVSGSVFELDRRKTSQLLNISFSIPSITNFSCENFFCQSVKEVCLTMQVPSMLIPHTKNPEKCRQSHSGKVTKVKFIEMHAAEYDGFCVDMEVLHLQYIPNPHLTEMLSLTERSIVNLHLMHTSYFMFVMVITLLCYALIKGRYPQTKTVILQKVPLDP